MRTRLILPLFFVGQFLFAQNTITLRIENIEEHRGLFRIALYDSKQGFEKEEETGAFRTKQQKVLAKGFQEVVLEDIPNGKYALKMHQDEDEDNKFDSFMGIPREPYGFSNNPKIRFSPPDYEECVFVVDGNIKLKVILK